MGLLKFAAKAVGTVALTATGIVSAVGEAVVGTASGSELADELAGLLGQGKSASFNGIRNIWSDERVDKVVDKADGIDTAALTKKQMASTAHRMAMQAKKNGNMDKFDEYMEKYKEYMDDYNSMRRVEDAEE